MSSLRKHVKAGVIALSISGAFLAFLALVVATKGLAIALLVPVAIYFFVLDDINQKEKRRKRWEAQNTRYAAGRTKP